MQSNGAGAGKCIDKLAVAAMTERKHVVIDIVTSNKGLALGFAKITQNGRRQRQVGKELAERGQRSLAPPQNTGNEESKNNIPQGVPRT